MVVYHIAERSVASSVGWGKKSLKPLSHLFYTSDPDLKEKKLKEIERREERREGRREERGEEKRGGGAGRGRGRGSGKGWSKL